MICAGFVRPTAYVYAVQEDCYNIQKKQMFLSNNIIISCNLEIFSELQFRTTRSMSTATQ